MNIMYWLGLYRILMCQLPQFSYTIIIMMDINERPVNLPLSVVILTYTASVRSSPCFFGSIAIENR